MIVIEFVYRILPKRGKINKLLVLCTDRITFKTFYLRLKNQKYV